MEKKARAKFVKALVVEAFRHGPLEDIHADATKGVDNGDIRTLMRYAVNRLDTIFLELERNPKGMLRLLNYVADTDASEWDEPEYDSEILECLHLLDSQ